ncbi:hypothetical protein FB451DRAFT_1222221 [Mycena latifolia]|nr:hypothetical protein FB451DRAFT_1222221 [Mycena latifolia]
MRLTTTTSKRSSSKGQKSSSARKRAQLPATKRALLAAGRRRRCSATWKRWCEDNRWKPVEFDSIRIEFPYEHPPDAMVIFRTYAKSHFKLKDVDLATLPSMDLFNIDGKKVVTYVYSDVMNLVFRRSAIMSGEKADSEHELLEKGRIIFENDTVEQKRLQDRIDVGKGPRIRSVARSMEIAEAIYPNSSEPGQTAVGVQGHSQILETPVGEGFFDDVVGAFSAWNVTDSQSNLGTALTTREELEFSQVSESQVAEWFTNVIDLSFCDNNSEPDDWAII